MVAGARWLVSAVLSEKVTVFFFRPLPRGLESGARECASPVRVVNVRLFGSEREGYFLGAGREGGKGAAISLPSPAGAGEGTRSRVPR